PGQSRGALRQRAVRTQTPEHSVPCELEHSNTREDENHLDVEHRIDEPFGCTCQQQSRAGHRVNPESPPHQRIQPLQRSQRHFGGDSQEPQTNYTADARYHAHAHDVQPQNGGIRQLGGRLPHPRAEAEVFERFQKSRHLSSFPSCAPFFSMRYPKSPTSTTEPTAIRLTMRTSVAPTIRMSVQKTAASGRRRSRPPRSRFQTPRPLSPSPTACHRRPRSTRARTR